MPTRPDGPRTGARATTRALQAAPAAALLAAVLVAAGCSLGPPPFRFDDAYGPHRATLSGHHARGLKWLADGRHYLETRDGIDYSVAAATGEAGPAFDVDRLAAALERDAGLDPNAASAAARSPAAFSRSRGQAMLRHGGRLMVYDFATDAMMILPDEDAGRREVTLSPDGGAVAYVRENDLYIARVGASAAQQITADGGDTVLNGVLDWVYQEEIFGRGQWRGYWWADDGSRLAFLRLDTSSVPVYPLVDHTADRPTLRSLRYPRAGDPNPIPRLGIVHVATGNIEWVDLTAYRGTDILIVAVHWSPDGRLIIGVQDRASTWLELNEAGTAGVRTLFRETSDAWVEPIEPPQFLSDGSLLWLSARDGWAHVYRIDRAGVTTQITRGAWSVSSILGVKEAAGMLYVAGSFDTPLETHAYRVPLTGGEPTRLTEPGWSHRISMAPGCAFFIDTYSNVATPPRVRLCDADGKLVRVLSANEPAELRQFAFSTPRIVKIPKPGRRPIHALVVRPAGWTPLGRYPVALDVYGAPGSPNVRNAWHEHDFAWMQVLAREGFLACAIDPEIAGTDCAAVWREAHGRLGELELADLELALRWMADHENADLSRVAIMGHSYGGFLAAYAATHSAMFAAAIASAPVTDWRFYDSIYTERLMGLPANNGDGYARTSVVLAADRLHGRLLLAHGLEDDNVHPCNTFVLGEALRRAGKDFETVVYPAASHGFGGYDVEWRRTQLEFLHRTVGARRPRGAQWFSYRSGPVCRQCPVEKRLASR